jgi:hypothetical protein
MINATWIAALVSALLLSVLHLIPWRTWFGRELKRLEAYLSGTLAMILPVTVLWILYGDWNYVISLWAVVLASGVTVYLWYLVDWVADSTLQAREQAEQADLLRSNIDERR